MAVLAISFFTFIFQLFGVTDVPAHFTQNWKIEKEWVQVNDQFEFQASSEKIVEYCRSHINDELVFPQVVHSSQVVKLDGNIIATLGKLNGTAGAPFYQQLVVSCDKIASGETLQWTVLSYSFFFSRLNQEPYFSSDDSFINFLNVTMNYLAFGILLALSIFTLVIYKNRVSDRLTYSVSVGSLFLAIYFAHVSNLIFGAPLAMLTSHKFADISLWIGIFLFYYAYEVDGYSTKFVSIIARVFCLAGVLIIGFGTNGDVVQLGTTLPMIPMTFALLVIIKKIIDKIQLGLFQVSLASKLIAVTSFLVFGMNDILHITGVINTNMTLSFGIISCIFGLSISVAQEVGFAYQERDEFRKELEAWAPPFILKALKHEKIKFPIRKDLAVITYDMIDSSKYHDTFVDGRPIRAVILQAFSEVIIRNGGWRESHAGDSAYAHFGVVNNQLPPNYLAYKSALDFREFLEKLNHKHSLSVECGIGLHVAQDVLVNVHSIEIKSDTEVIQQKSFDTTSADVDLVHRIESFIHRLPGTNIALSRKFVESLSFKIEGLIQLGRFQLKGQKELTTVFVIPSSKVTPQSYQFYSEQSF